VESGIAILYAQGELTDLSITPHSVKPKSLRFILTTSLPEVETQQIAQEKADLLAKHYDLSDVIGRHAEQMVYRICKKLGYTELEIRKEKNEGIGINKRDIDIYGKHPRNDYYQAIEVRNRRDTVKVNDLPNILKTISLAEKRWSKQIRPALVATFASREIIELANTMDLPIALMGAQFVPEKYQSLYETLNDRLALNVRITDQLPKYMFDNITKFILVHQYRQKPARQSEA